MRVCRCATNPVEHPCVWVLPWQAAAAIGRPIDTIHTWRKNGAIESRHHPTTDLWQVCNCEAAAQAATSRTRWKKRATRMIAKRQETALD